MSTISDAKKYHEERLKLHGEIKALADTQDKWTAEDKEKWDVVNASYDDNKKLLDESNTALKAEAEQKANIDSRLAEIENFAGDNPDDIFRRINNGNAVIGDSNIFPDPLAVRAGNDGGTAGPTDVQKALALQSWMLYQDGDFNLTDAHVQASAACGLRPHSKTFTINLNKNYSQIRDSILPDNHAWRSSASRFGMRNELETQTGSAGGFTFGESFNTQLEQAMLAFGGMFQTSDVIRTSSGEPFRWPTANDTSNTGRQLGENQAVTTTTDPTFAEVIWNAYKFSSDAILVPSELLRDSAINLVQVLAEMLGIRLGRIQNTKYTIGNGAGTPKGIVPAAAAGVTSAASGAIAFDELISLEHSIDPSRRSLSGVGYMFHDTILQALRKLKNGTGDYLWQAGANTGAPDTLNTYPYQINQDMASTIATTNVTILFGQLSAYKIRQVGSIRMLRLVERYADNDQEGFLAFVAGDGNLLDAGDNPVKKLTQV